VPNIENLAYTINLVTRPTWLVIKKLSEVYRVAKQIRSTNNPPHQNRLKDRDRPFKLKSGNEASLGESLSYLDKSGFKI